MAYMIALHELGHCVPGDGWSADKTLDQESAAWEWAIEHAILPRALARITRASSCASTEIEENLLARSDLSGSTQK
jgi:hypothetical protein